MDTQTTSTAAPARVQYSFAGIPELTAGLRRGDEEAFRWLHAEWNVRLSRYCYALASRDEVLASEVVQATYLRVLKHIRKLPDEEALQAWLLCAARSAAADLRRKDGRYLRALARFTEWLDARRSQPQGDPEAALGAALKAALAKLPEEERALLNARYEDGESLAEIGERYGLSTRAVEGRMARLRNRLREEIGARMRNPSNGS